MRKITKKYIEANGGVESVLKDILSKIFEPSKMKFHKVPIHEFAKFEFFRSRFNEHPAYAYKDKEKLVASYLMDFTTFKKQDLLLPISVFGLEMKGKFSFMGDVSKFYLPSGLVYSAINNRVETSIPVEFMDLIVEVEAPAVVVFNMKGGYLMSNDMFFVNSLTYIFKENGKYLTVSPFNHYESYSPKAKSTVLRFFEFLLNLTQFFSENEKVIPFCCDAMEPELLTAPMTAEFRNYPFDPAHEQRGVKIALPINAVINENIANKVNEVYSKARNSFIKSLGQNPIGALKNFILLIKLLG
jgi:hypothetical protein